MAFELLAGIKYYFTIILCPFGILLNSLLFWLITFKSAKQSKAYKKVLYLGCCTDFLNSFWYFLAEPELFTINGVGFVFTKGILGYLPFPWTAWTYNISLFFVYFCLVNALIQFFYRWLLVCWSIELNKLMFGLLIFGGAALVMTYPGHNMIHLWNRTLKDEYYSFLLNGTEFEINGRLPPFGAYPLYEFPHVLLIVISITVISYAFVIFCGISVWFRLKKEANQMSKEVKNYQKQISIVLFAEALIPILTIVLPIVLNIFMILAQIYLPWEGKFSVLLTSLAPIINPIIKITAITSYRKWILQKLKLQKPSMSGYSTEHQITIISAQK